MDINLKFDVFNFSYYRKLPGSNLGSRPVTLGHKDYFM